jgi:hypothetical protein
LDQLKVAPTLVRYRVRTTRNEGYSYEDTSKDVLADEQDEGVHSMAVRAFTFDRRKVGNWVTGKVGSNLIGSQSGVTKQSIEMGVNTSV